MGRRIIRDYAKWRQKLCEIRKSPTRILTKTIDELIDRTSSIFNFNVIVATNLHLHSLSLSLSLSSLNLSAFERTKIA